MISIAVLVTSHNRREKTVAALGALAAQRPMEDIRLVFYLADAGSTDGTASAVQRLFQHAHVYDVGSDTFWNRGMHFVFGEALRHGHDFYLWLNDDTLLDQDAISRLLATWKGTGSHRNGPRIIVGSTRDPVTGDLTYGGVNRAAGFHPLRYAIQPVSSHPQEVQTMNGNCVLVDAEAAAKTGNIDPTFTHSIGDFDYGLRARLAGCHIWTVPGTVGTCSRNDIAGSWRDRNLPLMQRWKQLTGPKGLPPREWRTFASRYGGTFWFVFWALTYVKVVLDTVSIRTNRILRGIWAA